MNNDSMYSFMSSDYEAPTQSEPPAKEPEYKHANRQDMSKPYQGQFSQKVNNAPVDSAPKTSAEHEYWRFFTRQKTNNIIAQEVNQQFNRDTLTDFHAEKARYIATYNNRLER